MFIYKVKQKHIKLIDQAIKILNDLEVPVTDSALFKYCCGNSRLGWCIKDNYYDFRIAINEALSDDAFINTTIHELLHTIPNGNYTAHRGNWKKWANHVSNNSKYKITVTADFWTNIDPALVIECICPLCGSKFMIRKNEVYDNKSSYSCEKCHKRLYAVLPEHPLKTMTSLEKTRFISKLLNSNAPLDEIIKCLDYSEAIDTRLIIKYIIRTHEFNVHIKDRIKIYFDNTLKKELAEEYYGGLWEEHIHSEDERFNFEMLFACTKWYIPVIEYGCEVLCNLQD